MEVDLHALIDDQAKLNDECYSPNSYIHWECMI